MYAIMSLVKQFVKFSYSLYSPKSVVILSKLSLAKEPGFNSGYNQGHYEIKERTRWNLLLKVFLIKN